MKKHHKKTRYISIIIPVMNEEENIQILADEVNASMSSSEFTWECIWVDDFSKDSTCAKLDKICQEPSNHLYLKHQRNYGQSAALATGFRNSEGEIIVSLDGDGQNDPADIPLLIRTLEQENADMVNGWRKTRKDSIIRKLSSKIANGFRNSLTGESVRDVGCALRAFRRECVGNIIVFKGMHRFFPTLVKLAGFNKIIEVPVNHRPRKLGKTKYGINNRLWVGIADTLAVCWMRKRLVFPQVTENNKETEKK